MFLPSIWDEIITKLGLNPSNKYVTGWFIVKTDKKNWENKPYIYSELLFWIYFERWEQKISFISLQYRLSMVVSGSIKKEKNCYFFG